MSTSAPPVPTELQISDPTLDKLYGFPPVEAGQGKPPISRSYQLTDDFAVPIPPVPLELTPEPITAPTAPVQVVPQPDPIPAPQPAPVVAPNATPEPPKEFTAKVDLGDGSGPQVFKSDSQQGLIDKLVDAQKNATLRIRQLKEKAKAKPDTTRPQEQLVYQPHTLNEAEIKEINELAKTDIVAAWRRLYEAETGTKPDSLGRTVYTSQQFQEKEAAQRAEAEFIADHIDDFDCTPKSGNAIYAFLAGCTRAVTDGGFNCKRCGKIHDLPLQTTKNNLEYAFETLTEQGMAFMDKPAPIPESAPVVAPTVPIVAPTPVVVAPTPVPQVVAPQPVVPPVSPPPVMLSDRSGQRPPTPEPEGGIDVAGWQNLPLHEMRQRIAASLKRGPAAGR
jgi:hypothetical protein